MGDEIRLPVDESKAFEQAICMAIYKIKGIHPSRYISCLLALPFFFQSTIGLSLLQAAMDRHDHLHYQEGD